MAPAAAFPDRLVRVLAFATALVAFLALGLQLGLLTGQLGIGSGLWRFLGFFTILTNLLAGIVATAIALGHERGLAGPRMRLVAATSIALVGIVYAIALRGLWDPQGLQKAADIALHDAAPVMFAATWLAGRHGALAWRDIGWALTWPAAYLGYALLRGAADGWYAYWFLDPGSQSPGELLASIAVLLGVVALIAAVFVGLDRLLGRRAA